MTSGRQRSPYGSWRSSLTAEQAATASASLSEVRLDGSDTYWIESRPTERGRQVVVQCDAAGRVREVTPASHGVRTRVHEYGGGTFTVADANLYFANLEDQRVYRQRNGGLPEPLTPVGPSRYADFATDVRRGRLLCVCEDHGSAAEHPQNRLVAIDLAGREALRVLAAGSDFVAAPRLSPDGSRLAWLSWNHPNMPWDGTELWVGRFAEHGGMVEPRRVAGGANEAILQPEWSPDGRLYFLSDRSGWWNLYRLHEGRLQALAPLEADFGSPPWVLGLSTYGFVSPNRLVCTYTSGSQWHLAHLDVASGRLERLPLPYTDIAYLKVDRHRAVLRAASPEESGVIVEIALATGRHRILRRAPALDLDPDFLAAPQAVDLSNRHGRSVHALLYLPRNPLHAAPPKERPPLLLRAHGGPTASAGTALSPAVQFWTSRGFAFLDVNYGGSSGYGRTYRERLDGQWGVVDVEDCADAATQLAGQDLVDNGRLAIRGSSAGGYTALCALAFHDVFHAGASYYGIADLETLAEGTHKFEAHYLDRLIGTYPDQRELYRNRSPIHACNRISAPVILFQGLEDRVVPPDQAETLVEALRDNGIPFAYLVFANEQHGFRGAETIRTALQAELYFYSRVFRFEPADSLPAVAIENL